MGIDMRQMFEEIKANRKRLDACKKHLFNIGAPPYKMGEKVECKNCLGVASLTEAAQYARGYAAAGKDANDIIPGFFSTGETE